MEAIIDQKQWENFTPFPSKAGGVLVGLYYLMLMPVNRRIASVSGLLGKFFLCKSNGYCIGSTDPWSNGSAYTGHTLMVYRNLPVKVKTFFTKLDKATLQEI